jgi:hypothetical protein
MKTYKITVRQIYVLEKITKYLKLHNVNHTAYKHKTEFIWIIEVFLAEEQINNLEKEIAAYDNTIRTLEKILYPVV